MLFKPRGVTSNDPKYAGNSRIMTIPDLLAYRDTWKERLSDDFSLGRILFAARAAKSKPAAPEKLVMTSNGFKVKDRDAIAPSERGVRMVQSTLNKLTESNFDLIAKAILVPEIILNANVVADVVRLIYDKALVEPVFAGLYARLCYMIVRYEYDYRSTQSGEVDAQKSEVRVAIVEKCQQMFDGATKAVRETASEEEAEKVRKRNVNNIKFAGELFLKSLITQKIIDRILGEKLFNITPNDMDLEVVVNLLEVVGKMYEEKHPAAQPALWKLLGELQEERRFSNRIRFLLQNLIERRNGGWKPREPEQVIVEDPQQQQQQQQQQQHQQQRYHFHHHHHHQQHQQHHQQHHQQQQRNSDQLQTPIGKRAKSYQDVSNPYGVGARRSTSHLDLPGYGAYAMPPPPPPPPTLQYAGVEEQLSVDERKLIVLARPPETLTEEVRRNIFRIARDAVEDGLPNRDWITNDLSRVLGPNESSSQSLMTSVYVILLRALMDPKESERTLFCTALERGNWERSILGRGFAWCLTKIIAERDVADCPRIYSRFVDVVTRVTELNFLCVTKDIIARTARYLDVLQVVYDETEEWEEDFIHVWDKLLVTRQAPNKVTAAESMESMSFTRLGSFLRGILPDFVASMVQAGFFTEDELRQWRQENESNPKFRAITEELTQLYP
ncbi:eukaryotic translation initiation factor 4 gamma 4 [Trypanosoma cruzi]|uniref:MIF4G domain-containing protein n=2 Tax=Trypanosoma cruzi TaxID=5693 RepID=Q4DIS7_TRYCC|nr:hypothetical protein, conserved [Trypanosoma cruzi]EAN92432.1 hypothetical protein, conserved [Trypanosoma cruzi]KAF8281629.1 eukaryotic translation initiation factor 4 gamma 4 [Trypanosoma cruzi]PWU97622.1 eukaryotic translation initiation factor 4 gamma 4 [Trypanosoma cruzi]RNC60355.1 putative eukaryotic initiation factor 4a [Trypanosoma cruzi]|eukprot:XP_814283.1 hypothetical protein [Trypanosoma cruzi strain CL Brener]